MKYYKIPKKISNNSDNLYIFNYYKTSIILLIIRPKLSMIYYLKIDK